MFLKLNNRGKRKPPCYRNVFRVERSKEAKDMGMTTLISLYYPFQALPYRNNINNNFLCLFALTDSLLSSEQLQNYYTFVEYARVCEK